MSLKEFKKNVDSIDVNKIFIRVIKSLNKYIYDLNRAKLVDGKNDDGESLEPEYSEVTVFIKSKKSGTAGITDRVTLFGKGHLHKSIFSIPEAKGVLIGSHDSKVQELVTKYGDFLGLDKDSIDKLTEKADILIAEIIYEKLLK